MTPLSAFKAQFSFNPANAFKVGVEREMFIRDKYTLSYEPCAHLVLKDTELVQKLGERVGHELSLCQLETRVGPCDLDSLLSELRETQAVVNKCFDRYDLVPGHYEVADEIPLDVYPNPRCIAVASTLTPSVLKAACSIIGVHVHVGMPDAETAFRVYNKMRTQMKKLWPVGDHSGGKRRELYGIVAPNHEAPEIRDWFAFYADAACNGYLHDPRKNWREVRISRFGSIETRVFGSTESVREIAHWASLCHELCMRFV